MRRIYLDHAATTPLLLEAKQAILPWLEGGFGNPSSLHADGRKAKDAIDEARETLSQALGCLFAEVLFTSGGTEAANLAIVGSALQNTDRRRKRVIVGAAEHHCVLHTKDALEALGYEVQYAPVDRSARIDLDALEAMVADDVLLVSVMHANNELGTIQPARAIADLAHRHGALYHCDAVQTFLGELPEGRWQVTDLDADLVTISAHKVNGPKGVGAIYLRAGVKVKPLVAGGGQEREVRGGTENVAGIVGFGAAVRAHRSLPANQKRVARDAFLEHVQHRDAISTVASLDQVLAGHAHLRFPGIEAETMLILLDRLGISASSGAACSSGSLEPSHVLLACGYSVTEAKEGLRFTFGWDTTIEDAIEGARRVNDAQSQIRATRVGAG